MILIGLAGPRCAGKKTIAKYLAARHAFERVYFHQNIGHALRTSAAAGVVYDDVCFDYEAISLRAAGGRIWLVQRPGFLSRPGDPVIGVSTREPDRGVVNDGTLDALYARVDLLLGALC